MFKSGILNIRKVRSEANIKLFEYFGQPTLTTLKRRKFPTNHQDSYLGSPNGHFETLTSLKRRKFL